MSALPGLAIQQGLVKAVVHKQGGLRVYPDFKVDGHRFTVKYDEKAGTLLFETYDKQLSPDESQKLVEASSASGITSVPHFQIAQRKVFGKLLNYRGAKTYNVEYQPNGSGGHSIKVIMRGPAPEKVFSQPITRKMKPRGTAEPKPTAKVVNIPVRASVPTQQPALVALPLDKTMSVDSLLKLGQVEITIGNQRFKVV